MGEVGCGHEETSLKADSRREEEERYFPFLQVAVGKIEDSLVIRLLTKLPVDLELGSHRIELEVKYYR